MSGAKSRPLDVIVIGAGVVGLSTALWLQRHGHQVEIVDPAPPLPGIDYRGAASFGNAAMVAPNGIFPVASPGILWQVPRMLRDREGPFSLYWRDLPDLAPWLSSFVLSSRRNRFDQLTQSLAALMRHIEAGHGPLLEEAGLGTLNRGAGSMHLYRSAAELTAGIAAMAQRNAAGIRGEILGPEEIRRLEPELAPSYIGGAIFYDAFVIDSPEAYCRGLAEAILSRGGRFTCARAEGLTPESERLTLQTSIGPRPADRVVLAAGAWSRDLARRFGQRLNMNTERGYHVSFAPETGLLSRPVMFPADGFFLTPMTGEIRAAGTVELGGLGKPPRPKRVEVLERKARRMLPGLSAKHGEWLGYRPSTPDSLPFIGASTADPRLYIACGHGHLGLTLGGITGKIIAALISRETPDLDPATFATDRSTSGLFR